MSEEKKLSANEPLKLNSDYLRGTLAEEIADTSNGAISADSQQLSKFHGMYLQDDRDVRAGRRKKKLDKAYSFLIRVRLPGGVATPEQWLAMDRIADQYANGTLKITTRQTWQLHGVIKNNLKASIQEMDKVAVDTIAACGDVNRNVICNANPHLSEVHSEAVQLANDISSHLMPRTRAYHEIFLDEEKVISSEEFEEPLYGKTYLPRKFKINIAIPPHNDTDIYAQCLSFIAIVEEGEIVGYNVTVGGGMGMTHGVEETFPRTADLIGFCTPEQAVNVAEKVMLVQRDFGRRDDRKWARLKYTVERMTADGFLAKLNEYLGYELEPARDFKFESNGDQFGWVTDDKGNHHLTLFVPGGRVLDTPSCPMKTGIAEIAKVLQGEFRMTANQNLVISNITDEQKPEIEALLEKYKILKTHERTALRLNSIACVALPTCGLALAEAERYLPTVITNLEEVVEECGLRHDAITIRMTGCPNGCGRPYLAEIGFVGKGPNKYNVYLGAGFHGQRLNKLYRESVSGDDIKALLSPIIRDYAKNRQEGERFGDFTIRAGYVAETTAGNNFHKNIAAEAAV
ncbi:NADPH-dependent assimilatory sulfite reductase hemoprotein subunit [Verrucomicrobiaceae bacterium 5K15]|uniref:Sulfite reductase [NADPH] hemoprotein beta-component n=1 Tax=Oceaniferula flava TaxID=2800421 RepID=A0AAE2VCQ9_9BACT|nr:NADPH-dependent assimilatory sulfite reductase hemoprotein subunit [Oceaniferula flavus]MBK1855930.1 NADPH-dependent assimilatory sulfite reductase hemoprotein subunit [Oceaniferula flavus]MBM1137237.1 NADPH-dependent assimilatory sulfite reductase hemoprotein subunit [Oceaniferula flavus]